jgi:vacuolar-type H+-ATPase subunit E/Vma4
VALEDILAAIRSEADIEIGRLRAESAAEVDVIVDAGRVEAQSAEEAAAAARDDESEQQRARIVNRAHLVVERRLRGVAEAVYQGMRDEVSDRLSGVRAGPDYPSLLRRLFDECRAVLPEGSVLRVDPADEDTARQILMDASFSGYTVDASLDSMGGLELSTEDGHRSVRNTFEARMDRADRPLRSLAVSAVPALRGAP